MKEYVGTEIVGSKVKTKKTGKNQQKIYEEMEKLRRETSGIDITDKKHRKLLQSIGISDLKKQRLFDKLKRYERRMMVELMEQLNLFEKTRHNIRNLRSVIRRIHNDIQKGFTDSVSTKMSFVHKKQKNSYYIKCRFWWDGGTDGKGGQREVQVGSIPSVIDIFNSKIVNDVEGFPKRELSDNLKTISWDEFKENKKLMKLLRTHCKPLIKSYLITKLQSRRTLGYRIRTKDISGVSRYYDGKTINNSDINHEYDKKEIDGIIKKYGKNLSDTSWYKEIEKISRNQ